jgi:NADH-quinone oxidoreductase subunit A
LLYSSILKLRLNALWRIPQSGANLASLQCGKNRWQAITRNQAYGGARVEEAMTQPLLATYFPVLVFLGIAAGIAIAMVAGAMLAARQKPYAEKLSTYECGFAPFDDTRRRFDVRFYLVAILFIIFDLEVAFLFPWAVSLGSIGWLGFGSMMAFLFVLTIGFVYEWRKGALDWE